MNVKQQFSSCNQSKKINAELVKSLREQIESLKRNMFFTQRKARKNTLLKMIIHSKGSPPK